MKFSWQCVQKSGFIPAWPPELNAQTVAHQLTMVGLELEQSEQQAEDTILELNITPNRGDCLSVRGLCREIAVLNDLAFKDCPKIDGKPVASHHVKLQAAEACPLYAGRWYEVPAEPQALPDEILSDLTASGIASIHPLVDLANYVMLLTGQPLHVFDADKIGALTVRFAEPQEKMLALNHKELSLQANTLVIADDHGVQALAGIIGGLASSVTPASRRVFVESAHFIPEAIAGRARQYGLQTDAAYRFERGVDPALPLVALDLFTQLAQKYQALIPGEQVVVGQLVPAPEAIFLRASRIERVLGVEMHTGQIEKVLQSLGMKVTAQASGWQVIPPSNRFDLRLEADLIEELARIHGYDHIPASPLTNLTALPAQRLTKMHELASVLVHEAYHEIISYSFISENLHQHCFGEQKAIRLQNPLSSELAVMRLSLWPSLAQTYAYNQARQQQRAKLYEIGHVYLPEIDQALGTYQQPKMLAGLVCGSVHREEWGAPSRPVDFYDVKADVEKLLQCLAPLSEFRFEAKSHAMLHPGQSAAIYYQGALLGHIGRLHPSLQQSLELLQPVYVFELSLQQLPDNQTPVFKAFSKFPLINRRFAFFVKRDLMMDDFCVAIRDHLGEHLVDFALFDVYQGKGVALDEKSVAFSVTLQNLAQTWTDQAIQALSDSLVAMLQHRFQARLRDGH